ncbi:MAG: thioredoxin family protein [Parvularculaceae bacterium]
MVFFIAFAAAALIPAAQPARAQDEKTADATAEDSEPRPFDEARNAMADVDATLARATERGTRVLLILGGNWCHDSRGLAAKFEDPALAALLAERYELVWVDVGRRERNLDIAKRFGVGDLLGTPTVLIVSADSGLLNAASVHDWRDAASKSPEETYAYFLKWSGNE